jgi:uncharacterized membrane protein YgcG
VRFNISVMRSTIVAVILLGMASLGVSVPTLAQGAGRSVTWQRFDVDLTVQSDGSANVVETQTIQFNGTYQQGYRLVPLEQTSGASNVSVAEVVDGRSAPYARGSNQPGTYSTSERNSGLEIDWWFPPTTNRARTFVVRYAVAGATRLYDGGDQFQWKAIYADRDGAVGSSTVTVHLPTDVPASALTSAWYQYPASGSVGALSAVSEGAQIDERTVQFGIGQLPPRQGAEVRVQFPHGAISGPPPTWQVAADRADWLQQTVAPIGDFLALLLTFAIAAGGGAFLFFLWYSNGRDPSIGSVPRRLQEPPSDLPAPLAGTLVDEAASEREAVSALVDLADRGLVHLVDEQNPTLVGSRSDVRITLQTRLDDPRLRGYERVLLAALFGPTPEVPSGVLLSSVKQQFQASIPVIQDRLYESVTQAGFFAGNPQTTRRRWLAVATAVIVAGVGLAIVAGVALPSMVTLRWLPGLALLVVGVAFTMVAASMPRRTQQGGLEAAKWRAFAAHIRDTSSAPTPGTALPAHYLPYAVAFGVDQSFLRHLESVGTPPPTWFGSRGPGGPVVFPVGWYGGPWMGPGPWPRGAGAESSPSQGGGVAAPPAPNPQGWSDALAALLNAASQAMAHGGGSGGWSGGGFGGGGGGGGGSGGFR